MKHEGAGGRIRPEHVSEVRRRGYTIVERFLDRAQIELATEAVECVFQRERKIGMARGWHNAAYRVAYMLPQKDPLFLSIAFGPDLLLLMRALLGADCVLGSLNALAMTPGGEARRDGTSDFAMEEHFSGLMLPLVRGSLPDFEPIFARFAVDLKHEAEGAAR